jgi:hypothetical protein
MGWTKKYKQRTRPAIMYDRYRWAVDGGGVPTVCLMAFNVQAVSFPFGLWLFVHPSWTTKRK